MIKKIISFNDYESTEIIRFLISKYDYDKFCELIEKYNEYHDELPLALTPESVIEQFIADLIDSSLASSPHLKLLVKQWFNRCSPD